MAAGTHYDLTPQYQPQEFYRVESGIRKSGPWKLDNTNLTIGSILPVFTPVEADLAKRTVVPVRNVKVAADYANDASDLTIKVEKNSLAYVGMFLGDGSHGAEVSDIDTSNASYDVLTIKLAFGATVSKGTILFEATTASGKNKKNTANFVLYDSKKVENGITLVTLLMQAYEIKESKLVVPIHDKDKEGLTSRFQFDY